MMKVPNSWQNIWDKVFHHTVNSSKATLQKHRHTLVSYPLMFFISYEMLHRHSFSAVARRSTLLIVKKSQ